MVGGLVDPGDGGVVRRLCAWANETPGGVALSVCGLCLLAAALVAGGSAGTTAGVLEEATEWQSGGVGTPAGSRAADGAELPGWEQDVWGGAGAEGEVARA